MGFAFYYQTTQPIGPELTVAVLALAEEFSRSRTWLSCEPLILREDEDGRLSGGSKPTFEPDSEDAASAASEGLPDGTVRDLLEGLCEISRVHGVDWELGHDYAPAPIGFIRRGMADESLVEQISAVAELAESAAAMMDENDWPADGDDPEDDALDGTDDGNDDEPPPPLRLWTG